MGFFCSSPPLLVIARGFYRWKNEGGSGVARYGALQEHTKERRGGLAGWETEEEVWQVCVHREGPMKEMGCTRRLREGVENKDGPLQPL